MASTLPPDSNEEQKSFKMMILAFVMALIAIIQSIIRKPFRR